MLILVDNVLIFSPLSLCCCYNWIRIIVWAVWAKSMLSRLRTVFSFKIISDPGIILFMPIIVSVRQWGYSGFIYNEIWSIKFLTARAQFTWFSQGGNIGGQRSSIWSQEGAAVQWAMAVHSAGRWPGHISYQNTHRALHQGQLASFHCTINVWLQNKSFLHRHTPPTY